MTLTVVWIILIMTVLTGALLLLPRMARSTVPFGVRVPDNRVDAPVIRHAARQYLRGVVVTMVALAAPLVALTPIVPPTVVLLLAAFVPLAAWFVPYLAARRMVLAAKRSEGWYEGMRQTVAADTSLRTAPPPYPWRWAVPAAAIAVATVVVGVVRYPSLPDRIPTHIGTGGPDRFTDTTWWSAFSLVGVQVALTALLLGLAAVALRSKADLVATAARVTAEQYRRYASAMSRSVLVLAAGMNLTLLVTALMLWDVVAPHAGWAVAGVVPTLGAAGAVVAVAVRTGQSGHRLPSGVPDEPAAPGTAHRDDDAHWIAGLLYHNREDPALWVPKRFGGVGWTVNLARPAAWVVIGAVLVVGIGLPIWAVAQAGTENAAVPTDTAPTGTAPAGAAVDLSAIEDTPVADRLAWVLAALAADEPPTQAEIEAAFDDVVLAEASAADLQAVFAQFAGAYHVTALLSATTTTFTGEIDDGQAQRWQMDLATTDEDEPQITGWFFRPPLEDPHAFGSWDEVEEGLDSLAGEVTFLAAEVEGASCRPVAGHDADARRPIGSIFKLYVLGALADAVADGSVAWDDDLVIDADLQSVPTGQLQDAEPGTIVTVREAANLMIGISDNTAADHLIALLGRDQVERAQARYGHQAPDLNQPFLTTRELHQLKWQRDDDERAAYLNADEPGRRSILNDLADEPLDIDLAGAAQTPVAPDTIEWFASAAELCAALARLDQTDQEPVHQALGANPIVRLNPDSWTRYAAKGGSEPGVLAFAWLLERADGRTFAFATTLWDDGLIDQSAAIPVVEGALNHLATIVS